MNEKDLQQLKNMVNGMPLLFVEDDIEFQNRISHRFRNLGFVVTTASDGLAGWLEFTRGQFQIIVTDFEMPGRNGVDLAREIRKKLPQSHVILLTQKGNNQDVQDIFRDDLQVYLVKKDGMERTTIGIEDALFMACARINLANPHVMKDNVSKKPTATFHVSDAKPSTLGTPGTALARLRAMREERNEK